jgi:hypothetical protein
MADEKQSANTAESDKFLDPQPASQSQDASRHQQDALHHKFHRGSTDNGDLKQSDTAEQPEIPKVGSRDAPGG